MADDQLTPLQLGQILLNLNTSVRELTTQTIKLRQELRVVALRQDNLAASVELDRAALFRFAKEIKAALSEAATSESQEMRAARIDTPLPPLPRHGPPRPRPVR